MPSCRVADLQVAARRNRPGGGNEGCPEKVAGVGHPGNPHHGGWRIWAGWVAAAGIIVGLGIYFLTVGLQKANQVGGAISAVIALTALLAPYLAASSGMLIAAPRNASAPAC